MLIVLSSIISNSVEFFDKIIYFIAGTTAHFWFKNKDDKKFAVFDIKPVKKLTRSVTLKEIKSNIFFNDFDLVRIPRLSVMPVTKEYWSEIIKLSNKKYDV